MSHKSKYLVYGLVDPRTDELFYVGKSCSGLAKAKRHMEPWCLNGANQAKCQRIRSILEQGDKPTIVILKTCRNERDLQMSETVLICALSKEYELLNDKLNRGCA